MRLALWQHLLSRYSVSVSRNLKISCECKWIGRGRFEIWKQVFTFKDWKQQRSCDSKLAQCLGCKRFYLYLIFMRTFSSWNVTQLPPSSTVTSWRNFITRKRDSGCLSAYIFCKVYSIVFFAWRGSSVTCNRRILFMSKEKIPWPFKWI